MHVGKTVGSVLRIEKTSIHDGDGLRTVLFLKGCPLRCIWCSTPESQSPLPEIGRLAEKCTSCGACVNVCKSGALAVDSGRVTHDRKKCVGCFECVKICPNSAIKPYGMKMTSAQAVREIAKDEIFYFHSGGGVTISGGEPLDQTDFVREVLEGCRERGINRALESGFFAPWEKVEKLLPLINLLHTDLKHADPAEHKKLTGADNKLILDNIKRADTSPYSFELVVRTPLIPGINDSEKALALSAEFVKSLRKLKFMEFLAYHRYGTETYKNMGIEYPLWEIKTPDREFMLAKARFFKDIAKVPVRINGIPVD